MTSPLKSFIYLVGTATLFQTQDIGALLPPKSTSWPQRNVRMPLIQWQPSSVSLYSMDFNQRPGERDIDFIKRITSSAAILDGQESDKKQQQRYLPSNSTAESSENKQPRGQYQRIEEWDKERIAKGELTWEEKVQFDGQRFGNKVKQDNILRRHIGNFF